MAISLDAGTVIDGRYRLDARLGAGSFGQVWRATRVVEGQEFGRTCAIKVIELLESVSGSTGSGRKLTPKWLEEPRALAKVEAGGAIPQIFEANVWDTSAYIAMELLEGEDLSKRIARGAIPWRRALYIAEQIAVALRAAHSEGIIHRDLKPSNVILAGPRRVCVIDWGIAQLGGGISERPASVLQPAAATSLDQTFDGPIAAGIAPVSVAPIGTPGYLPPEAYARALPSPATDAFALGVVLYEMLTGRLPHALRSDAPRPGASADEIRAYRMQIDEATQELDRAPFVPLEERCPGLPSGVVSLVERLLARDPDDRPTADLEATVAHVGRFPHGVPDPPYTGLVALGAAHAGLYFGQDATIERVLEKLSTERAVLLWGPSGSGKSSLAAAGIAGRMERTLYLDTDGWRVHVVRPSNAARETVEADVGERMSRGLLHVLDGAQADTAGDRDRGGNVGHVVVVDQLEEVLDLPEHARATFCDALLALVDGTAPVAVGGTVCNPGAPVRVIATLRDDLEWKVDRDAPVLRPLLERRIIAKGVDANLAEKIVAEPARAAGFSVDDLDLVRRQVEDKLSRNAATLPVIQFALSEWWARRDHERRILPRAAWAEIGGVDGALSFVGERFFAELDADGQRRLESLMLRFFRGRRKNALPETELVDAADHVIVSRLVGLRLVRRRADQGSQPVFEVEHESLALHWQRLDRWLAAARADDEIASDLDRRAALWQGDGAGDEVILPVDKLEYAGKIEAQLTPGALAYVRAGRAHVVKRRRAQLRRRIYAALSAVGLALVLGGLLVGVGRVQREALTARAARRQAEDQLASKSKELEAQQKALDDAKASFISFGLKEKELRASAEGEKQQMQKAQDEIEARRKKLKNAYDELAKQNKQCRGIVGRFDNDW